MEPSEEMARLSKSLFFVSSKMGILGRRAKGAVLERKIKSANEDTANTRGLLKVTDRRAGQDLEERIKSARAGLRDDHAAKIENQLRNAEKKKQARAQRALEWEALDKDKPVEGEDDPVALAAINDIREDMGDYKLKTAANFTVKEGERINTTVKRKQIVALRNKIYKAKKLFNTYVDQLRNQKVAAIDAIALKRAELAKILLELGQDEATLPPLPEIADFEFPERRFEYDRESLLQFKIDYAEQQKAEALAEKAAGGGGGFGGFGGGDGGGAVDNDDDGLEEEVEPIAVDGTLAAIAGEDQEPLPEVGYVLDVYRQVGTQRVLDLRLERAKLRAEIAVIVADFDAKVQKLLKAKRDTEVKIKYAEHNHIMYFRELVHLKVFDIREEEIEGRRNDKINELSANETSVGQKKSLLAEKKKMIAQFGEDEKTVAKAFTAELGEGNKFEKFLTKVFKRKIKRKKPKAPGEDSDSDSDSDESDDDSDYDSDESDDEDFDDTAPVPGLENAFPGLFDRTLALREQRLDAEDGKTDETKNADMLRKESDAVTKRTKGTKEALNAVESELTAFQREKQAKLNELDTGVPLRLSQIHYCTPKGPPKDLKEALIFDLKNIDQLRYTIDSLTKEKADQKSSYKEIKVQQRRLAREHREKEDKNKGLDDKCIELQMLKFGSLINLEALETSDVNPMGVELRSKLRRLEQVTTQKTRALDEQLMVLKRELANRTTNSTGQQKDLLDLTMDKKALESALETGRKAMFEDDTELVRGEKLERRRLKELARAQQQEIDTLRLEIEKLGRKGGHVAPPTKQLPQRRPGALPSIGITM